MAQKLHVAFAHAHFAGVQPGEYVGQPGLRIDIVELGRLDQPSFSALLARSRSRLIASASRIGAAASSVLHY
jgi:hypothetical protein